MEMVEYGITMFEGNTINDDVLMLVNLVSQLRDVMKEGCDEPTAYDKANKIGWPIADALAYAEAKYKVNKPLKTSWKKVENPR